MQLIHSSVLLVGADHVTCQWLGLRALLQEQPDLCVLADVKQDSEALRLTTDQHPDHALIDAAVGGMGLVPLVRQMRRMSPMSRVVVVGTREKLHRDTLAQLTEQKVRGYLLWEGLGGDTVVRCMAVVREDDVLVGQRAVLDELLAAPERRSRPRSDEPSLTDEERVALLLLIEGLRQEEIAEAMHLSGITVRRMMTRLRATFGVRTTNALCWQAGRLGFVPVDDAMSALRTVNADRNVISAARRDVQGAEACLTATFRHMEAQSITPDWKNIASIHLTYVREHPFDPAKAPGEIRQRPVRLVQVTVGYIVRWRTITTTPNGPGIRFIYVEKEHAASPWRIGSIGSGP